MSENQVKCNQRRKLLTSAVLGGSVLGATQALPEKWLKPVVSSVVLPAHAETTDTENLASEGELDKYFLAEDESQGLRSCSEAKQDTSVLKTLGAALVSEAYANIPWVYRHYLEHLGNNVYKYVHLATQGNEGSPFAKMYVEGTLGVQNPKDLPTYNCGGNSLLTTVEISNVTPGVEAEIKINDGCGGTYVLPIAPAAVAPTNLDCGKK